MLETNARVLNRQKHRLSWDVAAAKDANATATLVYFDCLLLVFRLLCCFTVSLIKTQATSLELIRVQLV
jgi:hypothetical protein